MEIELHPNKIDNEFVYSLWRAMELHKCEVFISKITGGLVLSASDRRIVSVLACFPTQLPVKLDITSFDKIKTVEESLRLLDKLGFYV
jgi:hypothetical protein